MKQVLKFSMLGENDDTHQVTIEQDKNNSANLSAFCTCGEAQHGAFCIHRFEILEGDVSNLVSDNIDDVNVLKSWIVGSDIEVAMKELAKAKTDLQTAREKVAYCRKMLVRRMLD